MAGLAVGTGAVGRRALGAGILLALAWLGTGCSPAPQAVIAVERESGGTLRLLTPDCPGMVIGDYSVIRDDEHDAELRNWAIHNTSWTQSLGSVRIFEVPKGWKAYADDLDPLAKGIPYMATMDASVSGKGLEGNVPFTLDQVGKLKSGEVLVSDGDKGSKAVSRADFLRDGKKACGSV